MFGGRTLWVVRVEYRGRVLVVCKESQGSADLHVHMADKKGCSKPCWTRDVIALACSSCGAGILLAIFEYENSVRSHVYDTLIGERGVLLCLCVVCEAWLNAKIIDFKACRCNERTNKPEFVVRTRSNSRREQLESSVYRNADDTSHHESARQSSSL